MISLEALPEPSPERIALRIKPAAERAIRRGHPWLFEDSIRSQNRQGNPGDLAVLFDRNNRFLAVGLFDPEGPIRVRILQHGRPKSIDQAWFQVKIKEAAGIRSKLLLANVSGYRLVNGENDGLPALIIDRYDNNYVLKIYSTGWIPHLKTLIRALADTVNIGWLVLRLSRKQQRTGRDLHGLVDGQTLLGKRPDKPVQFVENGLRFEVDLEHGQKTGFYLDHRDNRARVERLVKEEDGIIRVLNVFSYSGAFSLYAARGGAREIVSLDANRLALEAAQRNFAINGQCAPVAAAQHTTIWGDAFIELGRLKEAGERFDLVIIDPPSFTRQKADIEQALRTYRYLTKKGLVILRNGGTLVISSCSSRVASGLFFETICETAEDCGRSLGQIVRTGHPIDHPIGFPEGEYLKCLFARVD